MVKPTYFRDDAGVTVRSLHLVYDTDALTYDNHPEHGAFIVPSYAVTGRGNVVETLNAHFSKKGVTASGWRLTPPVFRHVDDLGMYLGAAEVET